MRLIKDHDKPDALLQNFEEYLRSSGADFFQTGRAITVGRAPARIDCMGGIADYSGSVVFEGPLRRAAVVAFQPRDDTLLKVLSVSADQSEEPRQAEFDLRSFRHDGGTKSYEEMNALFTQNPSTEWAANILGAALVLDKEGLHRFEHGGGLLLWRDLPMGAGVGSSAALQVAAMFALAAALKLDIPGLRLAELAQTVENRIVGAPCGIMDQVTSALGEAGKLIVLRCQRPAAGPTEPCELLGLRELPPEVKLFGLNSRVQHSVGGEAYATARISAFMGLKIILTEKERRGRPVADKDHYLCNITPATYLEEFRQALPEQMTGAEFLDAFGQTTDEVTRVDPGVTYRVRAGTDHPVFENARVLAFIECMARACDGDRTALVEAGGLMYASHGSYSWNCNLGCEETDLLVRLVRARGPEEGLYGAKISGGGSGGTVVILARSGAHEAIGEIAAEYEAQTGLRPDIFDGTSPGAYAFGPRAYRLEGAATDD